jgi:phosphatidylethanolamine-binding protein (PEBP) family uncharacterized protein
MLAAGVAAAAGALAGCGGADSPASSASGPRPLALTSPALSANGPIPALYTCAGRNISPPLTWGPVPAGTRELALFLLDLGHTESIGGRTGARLRVAWAIHGIPPRLHTIATGRLPAGAVAGRQRYSICPPKGGTGEYMFRLYALPARLSAQGGRPTDIEVFDQINRASTAEGELLASYTRG